jgi:hypothetical protein
LDEILIQKEIVERSINTILIVKRINPRTQPGFAKAFGQCVEQIWGYKRLVTELETLRMTAYDSENPHHEVKLLALWKALCPDIPLESRITKQWQDIGFQGDDPSTDFRGMGILGLENLLYFATKYPGTSRHVLSHSHHPKFGYTFSIVGINLTSMAYRLVKTGSVKSHFYNSVNRYPTLDSFNQFYCYLFYEFDLYWMECRPESIMEFNLIQQKFEKNILKAADSEKCIFKMNLSVENI